MHERMFKDLIDPFQTYYNLNYSRLNPSFHNTLDEIVTRLLALSAGFDELMEINSIILKENRLKMTTTIDERTNTLRVSIGSKHTMELNLTDLVGGPATIIP
jgi:ppGpp synthetase/RelA/SpoT-type nucleotidyltranferase